MANKPRRELKKIRIRELSAVDSPAMEGAVAVLLKRADDEGEGAAQSREDDPEHEQPTDGPLALETAERQEDPMTIKKDEKGAPAAGDVQAALDAANATNATLTKRLERLEKAGSLRGAELEHFDKLSDEAARDAFLAKDKAGRAAEVKAALVNASEKPVLYKAKDGTEYVDAHAAKLAKRSDDQEAELEKMRTERADEILEKRAEKELPSLKGTTSDRAALLKAVDSIADKGQRERLAEILKAANTASQWHSQVLGTVEPVDVNKAATTTQEANAQMDALTKARIKEKGEDEFTAYNAVAKANPDLYRLAIGTSKAG